MSTIGTPRSTLVNGGRNTAASIASTPNVDMDEDRPSHGFKVGQPDKFQGDRKALND